MTAEPALPGQRELTDVLYELTQTVAAARELPEIYDAALHCLATSLGVRRSAILLLDDDGVMRFEAWRDLSEAYRAGVDGHSPWSIDTADPAPVLVSDVREEPTLASLLPVIEAEGIRALAFVPLQADGRLLGKFMLYYSEPHQFARHEVTVALTVATNVAFAIQQKRSRDERQLAADLLDGQKRTLELLVAGAPLPHVLHSLASVVDELAGGDAAASIQLLVDGRLVDAASPRLPARYVEALEKFGLAPDPALGTCTAAAATKEVVITTDIANDPAWTPLSAAALDAGFQAAWSQPILSRDGEVMGTFGTYFRERRGPSPRDRQIVDVLVRTASIAIERARAEEDYRDQRAHLEALFRSQVAAIAEIDPDGRFLVVNDRFCQLTGRRHEELLAGMTVYDITHPEDHARTAFKLKALHDGRGDFTVEKRVCSPEGAMVWVSSTASSVRDADGNMTGAVLVMLDVTERRLNEERIREDERKYRELVQAVGLAVYTTDADGYIRLYNEAAVDLWGRRPEIGVEQWCGSWRIFDPDGRPMPLGDCPAAIALKEGRNVRGQEIVVEKPDGVRRIILPYPTPLRDGKGNVAGIVNVLVDVTEQRLLQNALEAALRAKDDFLGLVSHELKTPLTAISGNSRSLLAHFDKFDDDTRRRALADIVEEGDRLQRLVENMLVLSRVAEGRDIELEPVLLQRTIPQLVARALKSNGKHEILLDIPSDLPPVEAAPSYIDQMISNLISNAQKYSPPGNPIEIVARYDNGEVSVRVCDRGLGVGEEDRKKLFGAFFRSQAARRQAQGAGLGLAVCRRLAEAQGGRAWYNPRDGGGSEFGFTLPVPGRVTAALSAVLP